MADSEIVAQFEDSAYRAINDLKTALTSIAASRSANEAANLIDSAESSLVPTGESIFREFRRDQRHLAHEDKQVAARKLKSLEADWASQKRLLAEAKRQQLGGDGNALSAAERAEWTDQRQRLLGARNIQSDTATSLAMTKRTIEDAQVVGAHTSVTLEHQTEQMEGMIDTLHETNSVLDKSARLLRRMRTRLVTNKLMTFIIISVELAIVALIIYIKYYS